MTIAVSQVSAAATTSSPSPASNPLLQRNKLKPARKSKAKSKKPAVSQGNPRPEEPSTSTEKDGDDEEGSGSLADKLLELLDLDAPSTEASSPKESKGNDLYDKVIEPPRVLARKPAELAEKKVSRQQLRKQRKAEQVASIQRAAREEVENENDHSAEEEKKAIDSGCRELGVVVKEIEPDGHCLYSAIADQANVLGLSLTLRKETYKSTRFYAAEYMRGHPDEFLPFLTSNDDKNDGIMNSDEFAKYCDSVEKSSEWGGLPEINALSKYFRAPIWVLQAGTDIVKVGEDLPPGRGPMLISYHRKEYQLGEHYNSLRKT